ncbi:uncharacterized protein LOC107624036 isoform X1 [Arachis ipaensis]|uniref:uncharacterized protein LOC107624036 isoform X1 n=2 Tax=Arachis ipaensis TaxID=130454 RepID=UPI0007AF9CF3|nr:uncharacterized protein LOC107624036 isoform X1 [Arachis ipaensis]XP_016181957.1 uncharacterized protein LOC107624036 isoform X1 [Arachis ipaensis]XP_016181958.1 uncharacterized protein LOC107624036 isoform X1 [Arachis ipaensis]XP_016181959.1 uncharacterized protein LOC107624036 isoform X1 [Arachis ipaensis]XP_020969106.1 uncharacterized protein LOC107624036 isoform X1 [Arachis ipaensis]
MLMVCIQCKKSPLLIDDSSMAHAEVTKWDPISCSLPLDDKLELWHLCHMETWTEDCNLDEWDDIVHPLRWAVGELHGVRVCGLCKGQLIRERVPAWMWRRVMQFTNAEPAIRDDETCN